MLPFFHITCPLRNLANLQLPTMVNCIGILSASGSGIEPLSNRCRSENGRISLRDALRQYLEEPGFASEAAKCLPAT